MSTGGGSGVLAPPRYGEQQQRGLARLKHMGACPLVFPPPPAHTGITSHQDDVPRLPTAGNSCCCLACPSPTHLGGVTLWVPGPQEMAKEEGKLLLSPVAAQLLCLPCACTGIYRSERSKSKHWGPLWHFFLSGLAECQKYMRRRGRNGKISLE